MPWGGRGEKSNIKIHCPKSHESCLTSTSFLFFDCYKTISSLYPQSSYHLHSIIQSWLLININWKKAVPLVASSCSWVMKLSTMQGRNQSGSHPLVECDCRPMSRQMSWCCDGVNVGKKSVVELWQLGVRKPGFWLWLCCWCYWTLGIENSVHL